MLTKIEIFELDEISPIISLTNSTHVSNTVEYESKDNNKDGDVEDEGENGVTHIGIVISYDENTNIVYTVEGNSSNEVIKRNYNRTDEYINGYGLICEQVERPETQHMDTRKKYAKKVFDKFSSKWFYYKI